MEPTAPLDGIRQQITDLDQQLLTLLAKRRNLSLQVAQTKAASGDNIKPVRDRDRENALLNRLVNVGRQQGLDGQYVARLFHAIIEDSVLLQQAWFHEQHNPSERGNVTVAYLGARGSYSHIAAYHYFERRDRTLTELGQQRFEQIFAAVSDGRADYGILPVENTSSGVINEVFDLLQKTDLQIVGETTETIAHCLLLPEGRGIEQISNVYAHPQVHAQCSGYLADKNWQPHFCSSSAEAMQQANNDPHGAAIGSADGGRFYQLHAVVQQLANQQRNESRFVVIARQSVSVPAQVPAKTSLLIATGQQAGALVEALLVLKQHGLTMTKLASRPIHGNPWEEMFYLDIAANLDSSAMQQALQALTKLTRFIKVLGCYPSDTIVATELTAKQLADDPRVALVDDDRNLNYPFNIGVQPLQSAQLFVMVEASSVAMAATIAEQGGQLLISDQAIATTTLPQGRRFSQAAQIDAADPHLALLLLEPSSVADQALLEVAGKQPRPLLLAQAADANLQQWLASADRIVQHGNQQVALLVRSPNGSCDLNQLAAVIAASRYPVVVELGKNDSVGQLIKQAKAAQALGAAAISLSLTANNYPQFPQLMKGIHHRD
ncbi:chorismate mutase [Ferrimonas senticii]|uniref:chorismate mutase n=1 Tax=Ferrimonas senticii TaxID=394566 RepID=UPI0004832CAD|nr:chorismate mutase [Ferrimonas senticii]